MLLILKNKDDNQKGRPQDDSTVRTSSQNFKAVIITKVKAVGKK